MQRDRHLLVLPMKQHDLSFSLVRRRWWWCLSLKFIHYMGRWKSYHGSMRWRKYLLIICWIGECTAYELKCLLQSRLKIVMCVWLCISLQSWR
jgi:hypothetical protein